MVKVLSSNGNEIEGLYCNGVLVPKGYYVSAEKTYFQLIDVNNGRIPKVSYEDVKDAIQYYRNYVSCFVNFRDREINGVGDIYDLIRFISAVIRIKQEFEGRELDKEYFVEKLGITPNLWNSVFDNSYLNPNFNDRERLRKVALYGYEEGENLPLSWGLFTPNYFNLFGSILTDELEVQIDEVNELNDLVFSQVGGIHNFAQLVKYLHDKGIRYIHWNVGYILSELYNLIGSENVGKEIVRKNREVKQKFVEQINSEYWWYDAQLHWRLGITITSKLIPYVVWTILSLWILHNIRNLLQLEKEIENGNYRWLYVFGKNKLAYLGLRLWLGLYLNDRLGVYSQPFRNMELVIPTPIENYWGGLTPNQREKYIKLLTKVVKHLDDIIKGNIEVGDTYHITREEFDTLKAQVGDITNFDKFQHYHYYPTKNPFDLNVDYTTFTKLCNLVVNSVNNLTTKPYRWGRYIFELQELGVSFFQKLTELNGMENPIKDYILWFMHLIPVIHFGLPIGVRSVVYVTPNLLRQAKGEVGGKLVLHAFNTKDGLKTKLVDVNQFLQNVEFTYGDDDVVVLFQNGLNHLDRNFIRLPIYQGKYVGWAYKHHINIKMDTPLPFVVEIVRVKQGQPPTNLKNQPLVKVRLINPYGMVIENHQRLGVNTPNPLKQRPVFISYNNYKSVRVAKIIFDVDIPKTTFFKVKF